MNEILKNTIHFTVEHGLGWFAASAGSIAGLVASFHIHW